MLSRTANNLYWAARYLERIDHTARAVPVNYFSSLDGPDRINKAYTWDFINDYVGNIKAAEEFSDRRILDNVAFDLGNPSSILSCIHSVRENCRGAREVLSTELWGSINALYHFISSYKKEDYLSTQMHAFMLRVQDLLAVSKSRLRSSLLQNEVYHVLLLGIYMERAEQILRLIRLSLERLEKVNEKDKTVEEHYLVATLLRSLESFDMSRKYFLSAVDRNMALEFLFTLKTFPRSLAYCIHGVQEQIVLLGIDQKGSEKSLKRIAGALMNDIDSLSKEELEESGLEIVKKYEQVMFSLHNTLMNHYFLL